MNSHKTSKNLTSRALLGATAFTLGLAMHAARAGSISYNFSQNADNQQLDSVTPKGPLNSSFWNDSNAEGAPASGSETALVDDTGAATSAAISWNSSNTWSNGSGTGSENARIVVGYLDDGGSGPGISLTNIPWARYNVYGIVGSDQGGGTEYTTADFNVNGNWVFPTPQNQLDNSGSTGDAGDSTLNTGTVGVTPGALAGSSDPAFSYAAQSTRIPYAAALNPAGSFTVECWINPTDLTAGNRILIQAMINGENPGNGDDRSGWALRQNGDALTFLVGGTGPAGGSVFYTTTATTPAGAITAGSWQHVAVTYDSSTLNISIYVNGTEVLDATAAEALITNYAAPVIIGNRGYGGWGFVGSMDEVAIYPSALPQATIASHHANGIDAGRTTPYSTLIQASSPVGYWTGSSFVTETSPGTAPAFNHWLAAGQEWKRIKPATGQRGNYWKLSGISGATCTIQGQPRQGDNRTSISAVIIEEFVVPDKLVQTGDDIFAEAALGAGLVSEFRPGIDLAEIGTPGGLSTAATHQIAIIPSLDTESGTYKLIDYKGTIGGSGFAGLALAPTGSSRLGLTLVDNVEDSSVDVIYTAPEPVVWAGSPSSATWDTGTSTNWTLESGGTPTSYQPFDMVKFDDTAATGTVAISGDKAPLSIEFNNETLDYSLTGDAITGSTGILKTGAAALALTGDHVFTGELLIAGGKVTLGDGTTGSLSPDASVFVAGGSELELMLPAGSTFATAVANDGNLSLTGTGEALLGSAISGGGSILLDRSAPVTMSEGGNEGNIVIASGTTLLATGGSWAESFFGPAAGTITVEGGASLETNVHSLGGLGAAFNQPAITLEEGSLWVLKAEQYLDAANLVLFGGTVEIETNDLRMYGGVLAAGESGTGSAITGGTVNFFGDVTLFVEDGPAADDLTIASNLVENEASRTLEKIGEGTLVLDGNSAVTGMFTVTQGTLKGGGSLAGGLSTAAGTTLAPGNSIGTFSAGSAVIGGTLEIEYDGSAPAAIDTLAVAGTLDVTGAALNFTALGGALTADVYPVATAGGVTGTFASVTGTPAGYDLSYLSGGVFLLKSGVNPYGDWAAGYSLAGEDALSGADPDQDGIANAIEFVIGADPTESGDHDLMPLGTVEGEYFVFNFPRRDSSALYGPVVQYGSDLGGWETAAAGSPAATPVVVETVEDGFGPGLDAITVKVPRALAQGDKLFARLTVTIP